MTGGNRVPQLSRLTDDEAEFWRERFERQSRRTLAVVLAMGGIMLLTAAIALLYVLDSVSSGA